MHCTISLTELLYTHHIFHYSLKPKAGCPVVLRQRHFQLAFVANKRLSLCAVSQKTCFAFASQKCELQTLSTKTAWFLLAAQAGSGFTLLRALPRSIRAETGLFVPAGGRRSATPHGTGSCCHTRASRTLLASFQLKAVFYYKHKRWGFSFCISHRLQQAPRNQNPGTTKTEPLLHLTPVNR